MLSFVRCSLSHGQVVNAVRSWRQTMRGGSWQRSRSTRQVKLADEDVLRDLAGAVCDFSAEAACLLFHNEFGHLDVLLNSQLLKSLVMAVAKRSFTTFV